MFEDPSDEHNDELADEEVDDELIELVSSSRQGSLLRPILFIVVIWFGVSVVSDWQAQLAYFFSSSEPVEAGSVTDFASRRAQNPDWKPRIPHNRYVAVSGVPSKRAQSERYKFSKLVGGQVYVEAPREDLDKSALEREFGDHKGDIDRTYFKGAGRAVHLSEAPDRYGGLRSYYFERYGTYFCGMSLSDKQKQAVEDAGQPCVDAYVIESEVAPSGYWWYVVLSALVGLFVLLNIWWLIRWVRDFLGN